AFEHWEDEAFADFFVVGGGKRGRVVDQVVSFGDFVLEMVGFGERLVVEAASGAAGVGIVAAVGLAVGIVEVALAVTDEDIAGEFREFFVFGDRVGPGGIGHAAEVGGM